MTNKDKVINGIYGCCVGYLVDTLDNDVLNITHDNLKIKSLKDFLKDLNIKLNNVERDIPKILELFKKLPQDSNFGKSSIDELIKIDQLIILFQEMYGITSLESLDKIISKEFKDIGYSKIYNIYDTIALILIKRTLEFEIINKELNDSNLKYINTNVYIYLLYELKIIDNGMKIDKATEIAAHLIDKHEIFNYVKIKKSTGFKSCIKKYRSIDKDSIFFHAKITALDIINEYKLKSS